MNKPVKRIIIVGGGSAGWLTAGVLAADHVTGNNATEIILIESPDVPTIGVGEGTWPSMRTTLEKMGISETQFMRECDASFKQGSKFISWIKGDGEFYYHPFSLPEKYTDINLAEHWLPYKDQVSFCDAVCAQSYVSDRHLAPKQITTPEYAGIMNYGYHLDAGKFAMLLKKHCIDVLGVTYISDNVTGVNAGEMGEIASLNTQMSGPLEGDLFIDCTGFAALLIGQHYQIPFKEVRDVLFNDSALAVQVPYANPDAPIESCTLSTATSQGWVWDIGLTTRRGVGHVFSSAHTSDEQAVQLLRNYLAASIGENAAEKVTPRKLSFTPGYREKFWHKNCVAVGIAAGFIEPLEATALALIELSAQSISEQLPSDHAVMDIAAKRFNEKFAPRWERIIEFLKLHYVLSQRRDSEYWRDNCDPKSMPASLQEQLELWRYQLPWGYDAVHMAEMFPTASFQYILFGMGYEHHYGSSRRRDHAMKVQMAHRLFDENRQKSQRLVNNLPGNRQLLAKVSEFGFQKI